MAKTFKKGAKGTEVKKLQEQLNKAGARPKLKADGKFGGGTETAVKEFQKKNKMKADGIVGPKTMAALAKKGGGAASAKPMKWPHEDYITIVRKVEPVAKQNLGTFKKRRQEMQKFVHADMTRLNKKFDEHLKTYVQMHKKWSYNSSRMVQFQTSFVKFQKTSPDSVQDVLGAAKKIAGVTTKYSHASERAMIELFDLIDQFEELKKLDKAA